MEEKEILQWVKRFEDAGNDEQTNENIYKEFTDKYGKSWSKQFNEVRSRLVKNKEGITYHEAKELARNYHFFLIEVAVDGDSKRADKTFDLYSNMIKRVFGSSMFFNEIPSTGLEVNELEFLKRLPSYKDYNKDNKEAHKKANELFNLGTPFDDEILMLKTINE